MPDSTLAGIVTASATVIGGAFTAGATIIVAMIARKAARLETKVNDVQKTSHEVHVLVNSANTRLQEIVISQQQQIIALELAMRSGGVALPPTPNTTGEPIVATALLTTEEEE